MRKLLTTGVTTLALALTLGACAEEADTGADTDAMAEDTVQEPDLALEPETVRAVLMDADGAEHGEAVIAAGPEGLELTVNVTGAEPGEHGAHIHAVGSCEAPDFKSAGGHWNPTGKQHGLENPAGSHFGDFPNLTVAEDGSGSMSATIAGASLRDGDNALLDDDGAAFVIHAGRDDQRSDPAGDAGARFACGVFE